MTPRKTDIPNEGKGRSLTTGLNGTPFVKGKSPNPGGKPKNVGVVSVKQLTIPEIDALMLTHFPAAVQLLVEAIGDEHVDMRHRITAACKIVDKVKANAAPPSKDDEKEAEQKTALEDFVKVMAAKPPGGENNGGEGAGA